MNILITGISGFVGHHFLQFLFENQIESHIMGIDMRTPEYDLSMYCNVLDIDIRKVNLLNLDEVRDVLGDFKPDYILHLASFSSVAYSWIHPIDSFMNNTNIFLNLVTAVSEKCPACRVISVGSSEEYGSVLKEDIPIKERLRLNPGSPYAVARVSQEMLSKLYVDSYGLDIVLTRSFNHIGPWQDERFAIPSFIHKILAIKKSGASRGTIETGNIDVVRDFVDVRDVVRAYWMLMQKGTKGEIYNICTGRGRTLRELIKMIADQIGVEIATEINPDFIRPNDNPIMIGENYKIYDAVGWKPQYSIEQTIRDIIDCEGMK